MTFTRVVGDLHLEDQRVIVIIIIISANGYLLLWGLLVWNPNIPENRMDWDS